MSRLYCALDLTGGQAGDYPQALGLLVGHLQTGLAALADRAYYADYMCVQIAQTGTVAVIPGKNTWLLPIEHDTEVYKERNRIEQTINALKRFRAVATRLDRRAANYFATYASLPPYPGSNCKYFLACF